MSQQVNAIRVPSIEDVNTVQLVERSALGGAAKRAVLPLACKDRVVMTAS